MGMVGAIGQFHFTPERYLELMHDEVPRYDELQEETARATEGLRAQTILELGVGTGETSRRVLARHAGAHLTGIDASAEMLAEATLPGADLRVARLEDPLPERPVRPRRLVPRDPPPRRARASATCSGGLPRCSSTAAHSFSPT